MSTDWKVSLNSELVGGLRSVLKPAMLNPIKIQATNDALVITDKDIYQNKAKWDLVINALTASEFLHVADAGKMTLDTDTDTIRIPIRADRSLGEMKEALIDAEIGLRFFLQDTHPTNDGPNWAGRMKASLINGVDPRRYDYDPGLYH